ncbi:MAG: SCO family protein [Pseudomonadota bacterium]
MTRIYAFGAVFALLLIVGGSGVAIMMAREPDDQFAQCRGSTIAGAGDIGGPFELVSETGETVTEADVLDQPALIYFGYTFCPDVCPLDTVRNADAVDILETQGQSVRPIFVTVDPARDTPEVMANFTDLVHEDMLGLTGSDEQVRAAADAYRVIYQAQDPSDEFYLVNHTAFTYLTLPGEGYVEFFRRNLTAEQMASSVSCFLEAAS